ncbi:unnamed protein product [Pleuronectes platessa]|uniref:Uncharacterized protein n=1 Tax=Pleuronectes platessa TaxID=8262 RepID=A0A9N7VU46_PLEPL|nr:unnamed protein product [Pleuronectes platessa]
MAVALALSRTSPPSGLDPQPRCSTEAEPGHVGAYMGRSRLSWPDTTAQEPLGDCYRKPPSSVSGFILKVFFNGSPCSHASQLVAASLTSVGSANRSASGFDRKQELTLHLLLLLLHLLLLLRALKRR